MELRHRVSSAPSSARTCAARLRLEAARAQRRAHQPHGSGRGALRPRARDATEHVPARSITLIITNPPMGRRVLDPSALPRLLDAFISHAALLLAPGGRLVWMSPLGAHSIQVAAEAGPSSTIAERSTWAAFAPSCSYSSSVPDRRAARSAVITETLTSVPGCGPRMPEEHPPGQVVW